MCIVVPLALIHRKAILNTIMRLEVSQNTAQTYLTFAGTCVSGFDSRVRSFSDRQYQNNPVSFTYCRHSRLVEGSRVNVWLAAEALEFSTYPPDCTHSFQSEGQAPLHCAAGTARSSLVASREELRIVRNICMPPTSQSVYTKTGSLEATLGGYNLEQQATYVAH
jgi:hypothetical protein